MPIKSIPQTKTYASRAPTKNQQQQNEVEEKAKEKQSSSPLKIDDSNDQVECMNMTEIDLKQPISPNSDKSSIYTISKMAPTGIASGNKIVQSQISIRSNFEDGLVLNSVEI